MQRYADITRQEYLAAGIRVALHRQIDLATEPRWARTGMTFGEDADLTSRLVIAYIRGFQGAVAMGSSGVGVLIPETGRPGRDGIAAGDGAGGLFFPTRVLTPLGF